MEIGSEGEVGASVDQSVPIYSKRKVDKKDAVLLKRIDDL